MTVCAACLGDETCWVCLGHGVLDDREGPRPCHRCYGSGRCPLCQDIKLADITEPPMLRLGPLTFRRRGGS